MQMNLKTSKCKKQSGAQKDVGGGGGLVGDCVLQIMQGKTAKYDYEVL